MTESALEDAAREKEPWQRPAPDPLGNVDELTAERLEEDQDDD